MKIASVETFATRQVCLVRVRSDDGAEGWGQTAPFNADITATVLHRQAAPHVLGMDPLAVDCVSDRVIDEEYKFPWSYVCRALAGVDTALWDLRAKLEGKSVCALLGGEPRPFPVYGSSMRRDTTPKDEARRLAALADESGYRAFKVRIGKKTGHDEDEWLGRTEALIPAVRAAVGPDVALHVDGNSCYTPAKAIEVGRLLERYGVDHFEEPCPYWELEWTAEVTAALDVPVAGGEQDNDLAQWRRMIAMDAVDIVQPDVCYVGGLTRALRVADIAHRPGKTCVPHSANHSLVTVFALHMMGAIPNAGPFVEFSIEPQGWAREIFAPTLEVADGHVLIPEGPGWGVQIREDWLQSAAHEVTS